MKLKCRTLPLQSFIIRRYWRNSSCRLWISFHCNKSRWQNHWHFCLIYSTIFSQKYDVTTSFYIYTLKAIALIFLISILSILYQSNDLSALENYYMTTHRFTSMRLNGFPSFAKLLLWIGPAPRLHFSF